MWDASTLVVIALVFLLAGFVKGVVGMGLPTVSIALLAAFIGLKEGIALMVVPTFVSNFWQACVGGQAIAITRRIWAMLALLTMFTWVGGGILAGADAGPLAVMLGCLLILYSVQGLIGPQLPPPGRHEAWLTPLVGVLSGFANGMAGSFVVPGVVYLQALGLPRDALIQAMGLAFMVGALALAVALTGHGLFPAEYAGLSTAALVPTVIGMVAGQTLRWRMPEPIFRRVFFVALLIFGLWLAVRPLLI